MQVKDYWLDEASRNRANRPLYIRMVRALYGPGCEVFVGHHINFRLSGDDAGEENEIPSADTLLFDHGIMAANFGTDAPRLMAILAGLAPGEREAAVEKELARLDGVGVPFADLVEVRDHAADSV